MTVRVAVDSVRAIKTEEAKNTATNLHYIYPHRNLKTVDPPVHDAASARIHVLIFQSSRS